ncbi:MAG: hypothetical protein CO064_08225 [Anaerolineae bacterium CG_4_9_14_0_8_um_filter_58_9]|nr:MAG: hypothetical protein CO064_08225 [Anaerolineae bacterium CG_4_9_14_0_8_um_filter_58_9]
MVMKSATFPNSVYEVMRQVTGETVAEAALPIVLKDLLRYKKEVLRAKITSFEKKYGMSLGEFEQACLDGRIEAPFSYEVESDNWDWDSAVTELKDTEELELWLE